MLKECWWQLSILILLSYFISNFCGAVIISNYVIHKDIRKLGSKNPGTTNMARVFGFKYGIVTFMIDCIKGFMCALIGKLIFASFFGNDVGTYAGYIAGLAVIIGHNYPVLLKFKGGKGFASGIGIFLALAPGFTITLLLIGTVILVIIDRMSVCAMLFFLIEAIYHVIMFWNNNLWIPIITLVYFVLVVIAHRSNIERLIHGEEKKLGLINRIKRK